MNTSSKSVRSTAIRANNCSVVRINGRNVVSMKRVRRVKRLRVLVLLSAVIVLCALFMPRTAVSAVPEKFVTYTVRPGDTLWNYAATITPKNSDISDSVERLLVINHLSSPDLEVGQSINVPVIDAE